MAFRCSGNEVGAREADEAAPVARAAADAARVAGKAEAGAGRDGATSGEEENVLASRMVEREEWRRIG